MTDGDGRGHLTSSSWTLVQLLQVKELAPIYLRRVPPRPNPKGSHCREAPQFLPAHVAPTLPRFGGAFFYAYRRIAKSAGTGDPHTKCQFRPDLPPETDAPPPERDGWSPSKTQRARETSWWR